MKYVPTYVPEVDILVPEDVVSPGSWVRTAFHKIRRGDRVMVVRTANGVRQFVESIVDSIDEDSRTWSNAFGVEVVFPMDTDIFTLREAHDGRFPEDSERELGG